MITEDIIAQLHTTLAEVKEERRLDLKHYEEVLHEQALCIIRLQAQNAHLLREVLNK